VCATVRHNPQVREKGDRTVRRLNIFTTEFQYDPQDAEGYRGGSVRLGRPIGAHKLAGSLYELPGGEAVCPYHYEHGDEEWLLVLAGNPTVRDPDGEECLQPGDLVCFTAGPQGAHKVSNHSQETVRVLMLSTANLPAVAVYPDSDKIGVFTEDGRDDVMVRREQSVDYYDGERP
jgi:uncharacterized cupin superfamily protein